MGFITLHKHCLVLCSSNMISFILFLTLFSQTFTASCPSVGTSFVFGFIQNYYEGSNGSLYAIVTNDNRNTATVNVNVPFLGQNYDISVSASGSTKINFTTTLQVSGAVDEFENANKAVILSSSLPVRVYGGSELMGGYYSLDGFTVLPVSSLGNDYSASTYKKQPTRYWPNRFLLVTTENDTVISFNGSVFSSPVQRTVGGSFEILSYNSHNDLTGVHVYANKPIAFISGSDCGFSGRTGSNDIGVTMFLPLKCWGTQFAVKTMFNATIGNTIHVTGTRDNTLLSINNGGTTQTIYINASSDETIEIAEDSWLTITSSSPVQVAHVGAWVGFLNGIANYGAPSLSQVLPYTQYSKGTVLFSTIGQYRLRKTVGYPFLHYINLVAKNGYLSSITLDGSTASNWTYLGESGFAATTISISSGLHTVACSATDCSFYGMAYGYGFSAGYSFAIGSGEGSNCVCGERTRNAYGGVGTISSPGYPGNYCNNLNCVYYLYADGNPVALRFLHFSIEGNYYDTLTIYCGYGTSSELVTRCTGNACFNVDCGVLIPETNYTTLVFSTNGSQSGDGFSAQFYAHGTTTSTSTASTTSVTSTSTSTTTSTTATSTTTTTKVTTTTSVSSQFTTIRGKAFTPGDGVVSFGSSKQGYIEVSHAFLNQSTTGSITAFLGGNITISRGFVNQADASSITALATSTMVFYVKATLASKANITSTPFSIVNLRGDLTLGESSVLLIRDSNSAQVLSPTLDIGANCFVALKNLSTLQSPLNVGNGAILDVDTADFMSNSLSIGVGSSVVVDSTSSVTLNASIAPNVHVSVHNGTLILNAKSSLFLSNANLFSTHILYEGAYFESVASTLNLNSILKLRESSSVALTGFNYNFTLNISATLDIGKFAHVEITFSNCSDHLRELTGNIYMASGASLYSSENCGYAISLDIPSSSYLFIQPRGALSLSQSAGLSIGGKSILQVGHVLSLQASSRLIVSDSIQCRTKAAYEFTTGNVTTLTSNTNDNVFLCYPIQI